MEKLFTKAEIAKYLKVSERTISRMIRNLEIPVIAIKSTASKRPPIRIPASSVKKMLAGPISGDEIDIIINDLYKV